MIGYNMVNIVIIIYITKNITYNIFTIFHYNIFHHMLPNKLMNIHYVSVAIMHPVLALIIDSFIAVINIICTYNSVSICGVICFDSITHKTKQAKCFMYTNCYRFDALHGNRQILMHIMYMRDTRQLVQMCCDLPHHYYDLCL